MSTQSYNPTTFASQVPIVPSISGLTATTVQEGLEELIDKINEVEVEGSDTFVTGVTYNGLTNTVTLTRNDGATLDAEINEFSGLTVTNVLDVQGSIKNTTGTLLLDDDIHVTGDVLIDGNVTIMGTATTINTQTLLIEDNIITLNSNVTGNTEPILDSGIEVLRGSATTATFIWNETLDQWEAGLSGDTSLIITEENLPQFDVRLTGGTFDDGAETLTLNLSNGSDVIITGFIDNFTTGVTLSNNSLYFDTVDSLSAYTVDLSSFLDDTNTFLTGGTVSGTDLNLNLNNGSTVIVDVTELTVASATTINPIAGITGNTVQGALEEIQDQLNGVDTDNFVTASTLNVTGMTLDFTGTNAQTTFTTDVSELVFHENYNRDLFVSEDVGSDLNNGLSRHRAFASLAKGIEVANSLSPSFLSGVTIHVIDNNTYTPALTAGTVTIADFVVIDGKNATLKGHPGGTVLEIGFGRLDFLSILGDTLQIEPNGTDKSTIYNIGNIQNPELIFVVSGSSQASSNNTINITSIGGTGRLMSVDSGEHRINGNNVGLTVSEATDVSGVEVSGDANFFMLTNSYDFKNTGAGESIGIDISESGTTFLTSNCMVHDTIIRATGSDAKGFVFGQGMDEDTGSYVEVSGGKIYRVSQSEGVHIPQLLPYTATTHGSSLIKMWDGTSHKKISVDELFGLFTGDTNSFVTGFTRTGSFLNIERNDGLSTLSVELVATGITYDNSGADLTSLNVGDALDELDIIKVENFIIPTLADIPSVTGLTPGDFVLLLGETSGDTKWSFGSVASTTGGTFPTSTLVDILDFDTKNLIHEQHTDSGTTESTFTINSSSGDFAVLDTSLLMTAHTFNFPDKPGGGTYTLATIDDVTGLTDNYVTGITLSDSDLTVSRNGGLSDLTVSISGVNVTYDNSSNSLTATTVQGAIDDIVTNVNQNLLVASQLSEKGVGSGALYADEGILDDTLGVILFDDSTEERLLISTVVLPEIDLVVAPIIEFTLFNTTSPVATTSDTSYWELECRYITSGESTSKAADEIITGSTTFTGTTTNNRQTSLSFTLDASLISNLDIASFILKRKPSNPIDNYGFDVAIASSWWLYNQKQITS